MVKKAPAKKSKAVKIVTPIGRLSYPYLNETDSGRENSDNKYKTDLLITKDVWKKEGKALKEAVLLVGRKFYKDKSLELSDFANPFKDTDVLKKYSDSKEIKGHILIRCKSEFLPIVVNAQKKELSDAERKQIKGGDYARLVVAVYPYPNGEGGVTLGLNLVQYVKPGAALGGGKAAALAQIDEIEIEPDDIDTEDEEEEEAFAPKKKGKPPLHLDEGEDDEDEDSEEVEEDEEDEPAPKKKPGRPAKKKPEVEEEEDDFSFDDDDGA